MCPLDRFNKEMVSFPFLNCRGGSEYTEGGTQEGNKGGFLGIRTMKEELTYCNSYNRPMKV